MTETIIARTYYATCVLAASLLGLALVTWFAVLDSSDYLRPVSIGIDNGHVKFERITPHGPIVAEYTDEVTRLGGNYTEQICRSTGVGNYDSRIKPIARIRLDLWFPEGCDLSAPGRYHVRSEWRVMLFGIIPLRPVAKGWDFEVE